MQPQTLVITRSQEPRPQSQRGLFENAVASAKVFIFFILLPSPQLQHLWTIFLVQKSNSWKPTIKTPWLHLLVGGYIFLSQIKSSKTLRNSHFGIMHIWQIYFLFDIADYMAIRSKIPHFPQTKLTYATKISTKTSSLVICAALFLLIPTANDEISHVNLLDNYLMVQGNVKCEAINHKFLQQMILQMYYPHIHLFIIY